MALKIYNTMGQQKERFEPLWAGEVRMYACGPTVYDRAHIGHARAALTFDVILRYLEFRGYKVTYVRNFTDVDDKIIARAADLGQSCDSLAEEQIEFYRQDMRELGLRAATVEPRATRHIAEMIEIVQVLIEKGVAYVVEGDVYFEVRRWREYGKLSGRGLDDLRAGARVEVGERKRDPLDFALWKQSRPGEPAWDSPWGRGRPGWHIECSAMSTKYLGESFDIHGGGADLIFPHHENEIAQSECATGKPFARWWIHNGFVNVHAEKMSKSLGNVLTVRDLLERFTADTIKLFLLGTHYRAPLEFSEEGLMSAATAKGRLLTVLAEVERLRCVPLNIEAPLDPRCPLLDQIRRAEDAFVAAMDDDFNTPRALAALFHLVRDMNIAVKDAERERGLATLDALSRARDALRRLGSVLGGLLEVTVVEGRVEDSAKTHVALGVADGAEASPLSGDGVGADGSTSVSDQDYRQARGAVVLASRRGERPPDDQIRTILRYRHQRRAARDWVVSDEIRRWLANHGVMVDDTPTGARWRVKGSRT